MKVYKRDEIYDIIDQVSGLYDEIYRRELQKPHSLKRRIESSLSLNLSPMIITVECEGQLAGFLFGFDFRKENWWAKQVNRILPKGIDWYHHSFELNELCVAKDYREKGIGYQLMSYLATTEYDYLLLSVRSTNTPAIALYAKLDYQLIQEEFQFEGSEPRFHIMYRQNQGKRTS